MMLPLCLATVSHYSNSTQLCIVCLYLNWQIVGHWRKPFLSTHILMRVMFGQPPKISVEAAEFNQPYTVYTFSHTETNLNITMRNSSGKSAITSTCRVNETSDMQTYISTASYTYVCSGEWQGLTPTQACGGPITVDTCHLWPHSFLECLLKLETKRSSHQRVCFSAFI